MDIFQLPNEILIQILSYLKPNDFLALSQVSTKFCNLTCDRQVIKRISFLNQTTTSLKMFKKFMTNKRCANIMNLNLKGLSFSNEVFEKIICKCSKLRVLDILNCSISPRTLSVFSVKLKKLTHLYWSIDKPTLSCIVRDPLDRQVDCAFPNVKYLYLQLPFMFQSIQYFEFVVNFFPNLEELHLHIFKPSHYSEAVYINPNLTNIKPKFFPKIHSLTITTMNFTKQIYMKHIGCYKKLIRNIFQHKDYSVPWKKIVIPEFELFLVDEFPKGHDIFSNCEQLSVTNSMKDHVFRLIKPATMAHLDLQDLNLDADDFKFLISQAPTLKRINFSNTVMQEVDTSYLFSNLFAACTNLMELNLTTMHFAAEESTVCTHISKLVHLRKLSLPSCALAHSLEVAEIPDQGHLYGLKKRPRLELNHKSTILEELVKHCKNITDLEIISQDNPSTVPQSGHKGIDLTCLKNLPRLEALTLAFIPYIKDVTFLDDVLEHCPIKVLKLYMIGAPFKCLSFVVLAKALKKATSLVSFKFAHNKFDLNFSPFWNALSYCQKLEEFCIETNFGTRLKMNLLTNCFEKLPRLRLFHLHSKVLNFTSLEKVLKKNHTTITDLIIRDKLYMSQRFISEAECLVPYQKHVCFVTSTIAQSHMCSKL